MKYAFLRTSTKEQSPILQLRDIQSIFKVNGLIVLEEQQSAFNDKAKRPVFEELKKLIKNNKVSELYVWDLDRIYRDRKKLSEFLCLCKIYNCIVYSCNQHWLQSIQKIQPPFNEMMYDMMTQIIGWQGEEESIKKSNRVKLAIVKSADGLTPTKSYLGNKWGRKPLSKHVISKIAELHAAGMSIRDIAKTVMTYDSNNNGKLVSKSAVHKTILKLKAEKHSI